MPRLRGERKHRIDYRHIIDWLVKKPGAFENYRYRDDLHPTSRFRVASDALKRGRGLRGTREYLGILHLAARESEIAVDDALRHLTDHAEPISVAAVAENLKSGDPPARSTAVSIVDVYLLELTRREGEVRRDNRIARLLRESRLPLEKTLRHRAGTHPARPPRALHALQPPGSGAPDRQAGSESRSRAQAPRRA